MADVIDRLKSALVDRYHIDREIGQGGMATVYLAHDLKHGRDVALKVLRPDLAATLGPERFLREIQIAARLQHPNILPVHDSGEAAGFLYYVMPFVEGLSLRERLSGQGELPVPEAVRILRDVADALAHAHAQGVLHRDIKPENIMLSGRHALVADFGVAKAVREATGRQKLTTVGVALGTPAYMAPEQAAADPHTDHRADIYALGVTAYELLAGRPPFTGVTAQAILAAHLTEVPALVSGLRPLLPQPLAQLVMRCLEKKPADRPQSAEELLQVLESLATPSGGVTPAFIQPVQPRVFAGRRRVLGATVAAVVLLVLAGVVLTVWLSRQAAPGPQVREPVVVLPFEVQGGDASLASVGVQAAERISDAIEGANLGRVVPFRFEAGGEAFTERSGRRVVAKTGAGTLITGTIAQRGGMVEVQAKVIRGSDLHAVWTLGPERSPVSDPTPALDAIRERVLGAAGWYLSAATEGETYPGIRQPPPSLEVFRLAKKGWEHFHAGEYAAAIPYFRQAFARDTTWLGAAMRLRPAYGTLGRWRERDSVLAFVEARRERLYPGDALELDRAKSYLASPEAELRASLAMFSAEPGNAYGAMRSSVQARRPVQALEYYALRDTTTAYGRDWQGWDMFAGDAYHMLERFDEELALSRADKVRQPSVIDHWIHEVSALAALGRTEDIERVITESYGHPEQGAPARLMNTVASELSLHGREERARAYAARTLAGVEEWPDSIRVLGDTKNIQRNALRILGRHGEVVGSYDEQSRGAKAGGLQYRLLAIRYRVMMGDTIGARALVDSARTQPLSAYATWAFRGTPLYHGAQILSLLGRREAAVAMLREAMNHGQRLGADEPLQWYWAPIKDYPPFQELVKIR